MPKTLVQHFKAISKLSSNTWFRLHSLLGNWLE